MPGHTVGNSELLQLLLALVLPDQLGQLVTLVRSGIMRIYGDTIDTSFLGKEQKKFVRGWKR